MDHNDYYEFSYSGSTSNSCHSYKLEVSPNLTKYWIPDCIDSCKPCVGMLFKGVDAQMLIDKLFRKRETCSEFFFNYDVDGSDQLTRIFRLTLFVERIMLCSEMLSHSMLLSRLIGTIWYFVPFTGVENHKKCITFGAGLLLKEDVESYIWVFRSFISAMTKEPTCIITDQDPAMRVAFEQIFKTARHRYCMWHIMSKVTSKILDPCVFP
ncbi:unnamed protein product [Cuscuta europaea]|uniref:MULE transposase domain-containing protein n=1 Tax=Cuscuta europaea TaxID=41803 RepID=A0A9P1EHP0_CUSEU|nr:unnamed protein product [Cuscuta europaea]